MKDLTKAQDYPKVFTVRHFKEGADTRDFFNEKYAIEYIVNNDDEERKFYENLNHEANLVIEEKLSNGVIK